MIQLRSACDKCDWGSPKNTSIPCLCGEGPSPASIMVIGDKPWISNAGRDKDVQIRMLAPAGARFLADAFKLAGLDLSTCYITNVMHCVPPDDADPTTRETKACMDYLQEELARIKPRYVLLLGSVALKAVLGKAGLKELHGSVFDRDGVQYMPTFHPHMVFREPAIREILEGDVKKFAHMVNGGLSQFHPTLNMYVVKDYATLSTMLEDIQGSPAVSYDLETSSLDMYSKDGHINCLGIATPNAQWIVPLEFGESPWKGMRTDQLTILNSILSVLKDRAVVGHNAKFDNKWLKAVYGIRFPLTFDTMLAQHLLDDSIKLSLKYLSKRYFNAPDYDIKEKEKMGETTPEKLYTYCATDVYYTLKHYYRLKEELNKKENSSIKKVFKKLVMPLSDALEIVEENGVYINMEQYRRVEAQLRAKQECLRMELDKYAPGVNWNSPQQVARVLYNDWGLRVLQKTDKGTPSTGEAVLKQLKDQHPGVEKLLEYRATAKTVSAFIEGWKPYIHPDGRMHPTFNVFGTASGRLSCSDPNLQQVPKDTVIRSLITAPQGWTFVEADYSQLELRVIAMVSRDRVMTQVYRDGKIDLHTYTASIITGKPVDQVTKKERSDAKPCFSGDTQVLTPDGWVRLDEYKGQKVAQYDQKTGAISFVYPLDYRVFEDQNVIHFEDRNNDLVITKNHLILFSSKCHRNTPHLWEKTPIEHLKDREGYLINAGKYDNKPVLTELETRILAMVVSDGSFKGLSCEGVRLGFFKKRKIDRCRQLLDDAHIDYKESVGSNGATTFLFTDKHWITLLLRYVNKDKELSWACLDDVDGKVYLDEAAYWDGHIDDRWRNRRVKFSTSVKQTADVMQAMGTLNNIRVVMYTIPPRGKALLTNYVLSYRPNGKRDSRVTMTYKELPTPMDVYCVQVPHGNIVVRRNGKVSIQGNCNFGLSYGMGWRTLIEYAYTNYGIKFTEEQAQKIRNDFFNAYPDLLKWHERQRDEAHRYCSVRTMTGRIRPLPGIMSSDKQVKAKAERIAINTPIQSFGSDICEAALIELSQKLDRDKARIVGTIHDSILFEVKDEYVDDIIPQIQEIMENPRIITETFGIKFSVPVLVEVKKSPNGWGS